MEFQVNFKVNPSIYIKDPESSEIGREIIRASVELMYKLGFEHFTFKKLAARIGTTEATVYRYFENKHRILLYILNWYWNYMEFLLVFRLQNIATPKERLRIIIDLLTEELPNSAGIMEFNRGYLNHIVIAESSKAYLIKEVLSVNKQQAFKPYKDLCSRISVVIREYNPRYKYPNSLSTTLIEAAHQQQFFSQNLPRLTDNQKKARPDFTKQFLDELVVKVLG